MKPALIIKFDGVLSSAKIYEGLGSFMTSVNVHDIEAIKRLNDKYEVYIIRDVRLFTVHAEYASLLCKCVEQSKTDDNYYLFYGQSKTLEEVVNQCLRDNDEDFVYVGCMDEDAEVFAQMYENGRMYCPDDASPRCKEYADVILEQKGGEGVLCELEYFLLGEKNLD